MSCNLAHPAQLNQQASCHRQPSEREREREVKGLWEGGSRSGEGGALEVSAMNFNACKGNSNISCQDMHMSGRQAAGGGRQAGDWGQVYAKSGRGICKPCCIVPA